MGKWVNLNEMFSEKWHCLSQFYKCCDILLGNTDGNQLTRWQKPAKKKKQQDVHVQSVPQPFIKWTTGIQYFLFSGLLLGYLLLLSPMFSPMISTLMFCCRDTSPLPTLCNFNTPRWNYAFLNRGTFWFYNTWHGCHSDIWKYCWLKVLNNYDLWFDKMIYKRVFSRPTLNVKCHKIIVNKI